MFVQKFTKKVGNKVYQSILLLESFRENGKVKHRTVANLSKMPTDLVDGIDKQLRGGQITSLGDLDYSQGKSCGSLIVIKEVCKRLGILDALGNSTDGKLALIQIMARIMIQASRLKIVEWSRGAAVEEIAGVKYFNEDDLYENLDWLSERQDVIENKLFKHRFKSDELPTIYLYDVTSSYLEGEQNELAAYGYNRDQKKGKKQIVIGLLCDFEGCPVSIEVFKGNTSDTMTVSNQLIKLKDRFGVKHVVFVGDRGMVKRKQIEEIINDPFQWHYITALTRLQIRSLLNKGIIQMTLFDEKLEEVEHEGKRYIMRRNPVRAEECKQTRNRMINSIENLIEKENNYLYEHKKASITSSLKKVEKKIVKFKMQKYIECKMDHRKIIIEKDYDKIQEDSALDGCYVITTDVSKKDASKETIHQQYKDLSNVEHAFRTLKTGFEEVRPVFVRKENRTRGHVFVCMLAYMVINYITKELKELNETYAGIFKALEEIQYINYKVSKGKSIKVLPNNLHEHQQKILNKLKIKMPKNL